MPWLPFPHDGRIFRYNTFIDEFKEYCLSKPLKPIVKLNFLKASVGGDALELIQNYTHGTQLSEALETLENAFSKPDFVVSEIYKGYQVCIKFTEGACIYSTK